MQNAGLKALADQLRVLDLRVTLAGQRKLLGNRALLGMVRGAMGHALALSASPQAMAGQACSFNPPCAYDLFHNEQAEVAPGFALPKPFVLRADAVGPDLRITLRLFGGACDWAAEFRAGLIAGLRGGLDLGPVMDRKKTRLALTVSHVDREEQRVTPFPPTKALTLCSVTPIIQRLQSDPEGFGVDPMVLLNGFALRLRGVARWHGIDLADEGLSIPLPPGAVQILGQRRTLGRGARPRPGFTGKLLFPTPSAPLRHLLAFAPLLHIGADTTVGAGRCRLETAD